MSLLVDRTETCGSESEEVGALMNITMIETTNAVCAFLPRSLAPVAFGYQGSALPIGGAAPKPTGLVVSNNTWTDRRTYSTRTSMS